MFDTDDFNQRLFFPRPDRSEPGPNAVDHFVAVPEGRVHLRQHRLPGAAARVLFFHGNGEVVADYDDLAPKFAQAGAELWVADYRGYGQSEGVPTLRNLISDAHLIAAAVGEPLVVMGRSLGSAAVAELMGNETVPLRGVIIESGAADYRGLISRRGLPVPSSFSEELSRTFDPLPKLRRGRAPLLVLHGTEDAIIDPGEARLTFATAGSPQSAKTLCLLEGHGHNDVMSAPKYWEALASFLHALP